MREIHKRNDILLLAKALNSGLRMQIIDILIKNRQMNLSDLAKELGVTNGALTSHIKILKDAEIIDILNVSSGRRGSQKVCVMNEFKFLLDLTSDNSDTNSYEVEIPVGTYSNYSAAPTCGLATAESLIGEFDHPRYFDDPKRVDAAIVWLTNGFFEYRIPNYLECGQKAREIQISMELSSEAKGCCEDWPSDIEFSLNGIKLGTWTSPGDFGEKRGLFTPSWWPAVCNQYGLLKLITVNSQGSFVDGIKVSSVTINDINIESKSGIVLKVAVSEEKRRAGGLTIFGKAFGNYPQGIRVKVEY